MLSPDLSPVRSAGGYFLVLFSKLGCGMLFFSYGSARAEEIATKQKRNIF